MSEASPKCILVVEDAEPNRDLIAETLDRAGYRVESAADGLQAREKVRATRPDVIVLDLMMPVMDGWTFLQQFRKYPRVQRYAVMVTSAYRTLSETAGELHVQAYLAKLFDVDMLVGIVERLL